VSRLDIATGYVTGHRPVYDVQRRLAAESGASLVELAVALPVLILIMVGTIDFARAFYTAIELSNGARAGAQYGAQSGKNGQFTNIESAARSGAFNIGNATAQASRSCQCATDSGAFTDTSPVNDCTATCTGGSHMVISVTVTATSVFSTISRFPGIPHTLTINRAATLRGHSDDDLALSRIGSVPPRSK
jgi:Flp pilus assembly protein TadG